MTFNSVWLSVLTMLPPARRLMAWLAASFLLLNCSAALAANNFNGAAVTNCGLDAASKVYSCSALSLPDFNTVTSIASGYTVVVDSPVSLGYNHSLQMSGSARLQSSGDINLAGVNGPFLNISGGTLAAANGEVKLGDQTQTITVNINAKSVSVGSSATRITGTVTATGAITTGSNVTITGAVSSTGGAISLGSDTAINGAVSAASISTGSNVKLSATLSVGGAINLGSGNTIGGTVDGASIKTNSGVAMGALTVTGAADLGSANTINGNLVASSLKTDSGVTVTGSVKTQGLADLGSAIKIGGGVDAGSVKTGSPGQINGGIASKSTVDLGSGLTITGNVGGTVITSLSPVNITGNVAASTSFTLPSGSTVNGNISGGALTIMDGGSTINGNVTMTGNVTIGSSGRINGDLAAYNVNTHASDAIVSGNAAVNAIYLDYGARVNKTITCTGAAPGAPACSCVTRADSSYQPTCGAAAPVAGPHHIQISHSGTALTCQPQTVGLIACANASCTAPHYTASFSGTLSPGNLPFTIAAGNGVGSGQVQQTNKNPATLSATSAATNGYTCINPNNTTTPCAMAFDDKGLEVTVPDHLSMAADIAVTIRALQAQNGNQSCVPLLRNVQKVPVDIGCGFSVPTSSAASGLTLTDRGGAAVAVDCGGSASSVSLDFGDDGKAMAQLKYPEVGTVTLNAKVTSGASPAFNAVGDTSFTAAPASIKMTAVRVDSTKPLAGGVFARAGEAFKLTLTALNSLEGVTKNFGSENTASSKENFLITNTIISPATAPKGAIVKASGTGTKNGVAESIWSFTDVGSIKISVGIDRSTGYYMDKQVTGFNPKAELTLGRFIPDHFDTMLPALITAPQAPAYSDLPSTQLAGVTMKCANASSLRNPCTALDPVNGRFIYSKQPFYVVVKAYNMQSALTQNYSTATGLAKSVDLSSWKVAGGVTAIGVMGWKTATSTTKFSFVGGVGVVDDTNNLPYFDFGAAAPVNPASIYVRAIDTDNVSSGRATGAVEIALTAVSGRMMVTNNYGSQSSSLPVAVQAQYYDDSAGGYVFNPAYYSDQQTIGSNYTFDNCKGLTCGALTLKADKLTFVAGKATLLVAPPLASGSANLKLNPAGLGWENFYLPSSTGRATFGIYRSGPVIYTREVHN